MSYESSKRKVRIQIDERLNWTFVARFLLLAFILTNNLIIIVTLKLLRLCVNDVEQTAATFNLWTNLIKVSWCYSWTFHPALCKPLVSS